MKREFAGQIRGRKCTWAQYPTAQLTTPHLGVHSWLGDKSPLEGKVRQLPVTKEGAPDAAGGCPF